MNATLKYARVGVVGSRDFADLDAVAALVVKLPPGTVLVSGGARGVDRVAEQTARRIGLAVDIRHPQIYDGAPRSTVVKALFARNLEILLAVDCLAIFWDGESRGTAHMIEQAGRRGIPHKVFRTGHPLKPTPPTTQVVNVKSLAPTEQRNATVFIGRPSIFGNPFLIGPDGDRSEVIRKYAAWFHAKLKGDPSFRNAVHALKGKALGCFCRPLPCHGDVIVDYLERSTAHA